MNNESTKKSKELLLTLIKQKLETRLSKLERRNKMHLNIMNITTQTINNSNNKRYNRLVNKCK